MTQQIKSTETLHDLERVMVREDRHVGEETYALGVGSDEAERGEGVPVAAAAYPRRRLGDADVLGTRDPVHACSFGGTYDRHDVFDRAGLLPPGRVEPRVHVKDRCNDPHLHGHHNLRSAPAGVGESGNVVTDVQTLHAERRRRPAGSEARSPLGARPFRILPPRFVGR